MAFENFPSAARKQQLLPPKFNWMALTIGVLFFSLSASVVYMIWYKNQSIDTIREKIVEERPLPVIAASINSSPDNSQLTDLQKELTDANMRYDMLKTLSVHKDTQNAILEKERVRKKDTIYGLLKRENLTKQELEEAKNLIVSLKENIDGYKTQVEKLSVEKTVLVQEKQVITDQRNIAQSHYDSAVNIIGQKEDSINIGSTLSAVDFDINSINEKNNGREKLTNVARKVDKLRITFEIAQNRLAPTGIKELFVCVTDPHGIPITVEALGSGKFITRNGAEKFYTQKIDINYLQGPTSQVISFDWRQNTNFEPGDYKIEVYDNGFKIGQGIRRLK
jgi:hypothetical protein